MLQLHRLIYIVGVLTLIFSANADPIDLTRAWQEAHATEKKDVVSSETSPSDEKKNEEEKQEMVKGEEAVTQKNDNPTITVDDKDTLNIESVGLDASLVEGLNVEAWLKTPRSVILHLYQQLPENISSEVLRRLNLALLTVPFTIPKPENPLDERSLVILRAQKLFDMGYLSEAKKLLETHRKHQTHPLYKRLQFLEGIMAGHYRQVCPLAKEMLAQHQEPFWEKATTTCQLLMGENEQAQLSLSILNETLPTKDKDFIKAAQLVLAPAYANNIDPITHPDLFTLILLNQMPVEQFKAAFEKLPSKMQERLIRYFPHMNLMPDMRLSLYEKAAGAGFITPEDLEKEYKLYLEAHPHLQKESNTKDLPQAVQNALLITEIQKAVSITEQKKLLQQLLDFEKAKKLYGAFAHIVKPEILKIVPSEGAADMIDIVVPALVRIHEIEKLCQWQHYVNLSDNHSATLPLIILYCRSMDHDFRNKILKKWVMQHIKKGHKEIIQFVEKILAILEACGIDIPHDILAQIPALPPYKTERLSRATRQLIDAASKDHMLGELASRILIALGNADQGHITLDNLLDVLKALRQGKMVTLANDLAAEMILFLAKDVEKSENKK